MEAVAIREPLKLKSALDISARCPINVYNRLREGGREGDTGPAKQTGPYSPLEVSHTVTVLSNEPVNTLSPTVLKLMQMTSAE